MTYPALSSDKAEARNHDQAQEDIKAIEKEKNNQKEQEKSKSKRKSKKSDKKVVPIGRGFQYRAAINDLDHFDIVDGFVVDYMHNIALGVSRQFGRYWFNSKNKKYSITSEQLNDLDKIIMKLTPHSQVGRLTRSLCQRKRWKAREWESWTLYYSLPILATVLPKDYVDHWRLLVEGLYLLLQENISSDDLNESSRLLHKFVFECEEKYGEKCMTFNVHQLLHLPESVYNWGPLWAHNGYPFENGNGEIVKTIHAANGVASQVHRFISFKNCFSYILSLKEYEMCSPYVQKFFDKLDGKLKHSFKTETCRYTQSSVLSNVVMSHYQNRFEFYRAFKRIIKDKCVYATCEKVNKRSSNSFAQLKNGSFIQCVQFLYDENNKNELVIARIVETENSFGPIKKL